MNYIFDIDDTLLCSEKVKKRTYFDYIVLLCEKRLISKETAQKALQIAENILFHIGEKDVFDTADQILQVIKPQMSQTERKAQVLRYVAQQMELLRQNYQKEVNECAGVSEFLRALQEKGSIIGINTGNPISFARQVVIDRGWPIKPEYVFGAGDTPDVNPYSVQMKADNIIAFALKIVELAPQKYKNIDEALKNITMVGDAISDYEGAKMSGVKFIGVKPDTISKLDDISQIKCIPNFIELLKQ